jgi:hypothetical protein
MVFVWYDLEPLAADIGNAYLNAPTKEKYFIITGPEFGELERGKIASSEPFMGLNQVEPCGEHILLPPYAT